jgi:glycosyltransferase involved in cell wall biosynthesis
VPVRATVDERRSAVWDDGPSPRVAVLISTHQRQHYLTELLRTLEQQELPKNQFEVVIVDDGSTDGTWDILSGAAAETEMRLLVLRHAPNRGPAAARNEAAACARAPLIAFTDDDCLPTPAWLPAMLDAFVPGVDVVQGCVRAEPTQLQQSGPWDHTIWVGRPSPFFETCNVAYHRTVFEAVGGFDARDPFLTPLGESRGFGEDAELAWRAVRTGARPTFAQDALVHHRCVPEGFAGWLRRQRHISGFPGLARRSELVARWLRGGVFLTPQSAAFDALVAGVVVAATLRRPWPLLASLPWVRARWRDSLRRCRGDRSRAALVLVQHGISDALTLASLIEGSVRHRRLVL